LAHELNNSLAPIKSLAASLEAIVAREPLAEDWQDDTQRGLSVIRARAESLTRFMDAYSRLAKLPAPRRQAVDLAELVRRVIALDSRIRIALPTVNSLTIQADADQIEQLLINLLHNATDAVLESRVEAAGLGAEEFPIAIQWRPIGDEVELTIVDSGRGLANPANLFVPFFTTKPKGSGIGLTLCRQIAEAHGGSLSLENRSDRSGCIARLRLPLK
jgi:nitrogen fixation/metabolism regulation signal transduction histidine kinase